MGGMVRDMARQFPIKSVKGNQPKTEHCPVLHNQLLEKETHTETEEMTER